MSRMRLGLDVWECDVCGSLVMIGRVCGCGRKYADQLAANSREKERKSKKHVPKYREPSSEGKFIKSFFFKKGKKDV